MSEAQTTQMERIEALTREYSQARDDLRTLVERVRTDIESIEREALPAIRTRVRDAAERHDALRAAIAEHPGLWSGKRRTVTVAGVRVGMAKGKGRLVWDDPAQVARLIRRQFPDHSDALIRIKEEPIRKALSELSVAELRKIGVTVEDAGEEIVIKPTDSSVDKLVDALLRDAERIEREAAE